MTWGGLAPEDKLKDFDHEGTIAYAMKKGQPKREKVLRNFFLMA